MFDDIIPPPILTFTGEYRFLSNFYVCEFVWAGRTWKSSEHAYQAAKSPLAVEQELIASLPTPSATKRAGKLITLRADWDEIKVEVMRSIVREKFNQHEDLKARLVATGTAVIEEGNTWRDTFWGVCPPGSGRGRNELGKILMELRTEWISG